ncbi:hypothetical protein AQUCO_01700586v1 [Aquilegia coerulea]|uniref:Sec-independent protein translocase protein TATA, chloroplastic n=1 Tax=Aquilegia coerulea TaxID=218851 RepID=A0A2G5DNP7_AQUCA|nr:hypothetical protein AQUCO_01700586v1 [Aquilegia coerulea]
MNMEVSAITSIPRVSSLTISSGNSIFFNNGNLLLKNNIKSKCLVLRRNRARRSLTTTRSLFGLGVPELAVIAGVVALVFGPKKLPEVGRSIGKTVKSFQQAAKEFETELKKEPESIGSSSEQPTAVSEEKQDTKIPSKEESV